MLRIQRSEHGDGVRLMLSGRIEAEHLPELQRLIEREDRERAITLDLREVTLVDRDAVTFLAQCEAAGAALENCRAYVRDWIARERAETRDSRRNTPTRRNPER
jgi:ABC-type transporter Mla MlaB component